MAINSLCGCKWCARAVAKYLAGERGDWTVTSFNKVSEDANSEDAGRVDDFPVMVMFDDYVAARFPATEVGRENARDFANQGAGRVIDPTVPKFEPGYYLLERFGRFAPFWWHLERCNCELSEDGRGLRGSSYCVFERQLEENGYRGVSMEKRYKVVQDRFGQWGVLDTRTLSIDDAWSAFAPFGSKYLAFMCAIYLNAGRRYERDDFAWREFRPRVA